jgi:hypothetical protein
MKHIHAELIKAWADGAEIEARYLKASGWTDWRLENGGFIWYDIGAEYRIKPEPKEDVVRFAYISRPDMQSITLTSTPFEIDNIKLTFDGTTNILKNAEVLNEA